MGMGSMTFPMDECIGVPSGAMMNPWIMMFSQGMDSSICSALRME